MTVTMSSASSPERPADGQVLRRHLQRLLGSSHPGVAEGLRRRPAEEPTASLIEFAGRQPGLTLARMGSVAELAAVTRRAVCLGRNGASVLVEIADHGVCRVETGPSGEAAQVDARSLAALFPCRALYPDGRRHPVQSGRDGADFAVTVYLRLFGQLLALAMPIAMMLVVDKVVGNGAHNTLLVLVGGVALLTGFQYLFSAAAIVHTTRQGEAAALPLRSRVYREAAGSAAAAGLASAGWDAVAGCAETARFALETRPQAVADLLYGLLLGLLMFAFSPLLLGVSLAFVPLYVGLSVWSARCCERHEAVLGGLRGRLAAAWFESTSAAEMLRGLDLAERFAARWEALDVRRAGAHYRLLLWQRLSAQAVELLQRLSIITIMLVGVSAVMTGAMTLGQYIAFNLLSMQFTQPLLRLAGLPRAWADHRRQRAGRETLLHALASAAWPQAAGAPVADEAPVLLQARGLRPTADGEPRRTFDFSAGGGTWLGVTGPSGCGKTTLLRTLAGLRRPVAGAVLLNGVEAGRCDWASWSRQVRLVGQEPVIFSDTIAGNIELGDPGASPPQILTVALVCGLEPLLQRLPEHLNTRVGAGGWALSGGERQRVALARAILSRPRLLLLDEATAALDVAAEAALLRRLRQFLPDAAVVVVSHRSTSLARCDRTLALAPPAGAVADGPAARAG